MPPIVITFKGDKTILLALGSKILGKSIRNNEKTDAYY